MRVRWLLPMVALASSALVCGCGGSSNAGTPNPLPGILFLSPSSTTAGGPAFTLTVNGGNFVSGSVVLWNGSTRTTTFVDSTQITAAIPAGDITSPGTASVQVANPAPGGGLSGTLIFTIVPPPSPTPGAALLSSTGAAAQTVGIIQMVSADENGTAGNGPSFQPYINTDGRFVSFESAATNLLPNDTSTRGVFCHDTCQGASAPAGCAPTTSRVSLESDGNQPAGVGFGPGTIGAGGRFAVFRSTEPSAGPSLITDSHVVVRDMCTGAPADCTPRTIRVSADSQGSPANSASQNPLISADGRVVVFESLATNLVPGITGGRSHIYARDTCFGTADGCVPRTILISATPGDTPGNGHSRLSSVSSDGRFVLFDSDSSDLVPHSGTNGTRQVFLRDTCIGAPAPCLPQTTLVSADSGGHQGNDQSFANFGGGLSATGRFLAFASQATNLLPTLSAPGQVYVRDTCFGAPAGCTPKLVIVSVTSSGKQVGGSSPTISGDGRFVAFVSLFPGLSHQQVFFALTGF